MTVPQAAQSTGFLQYVIGANLNLHACSNCLKKFNSSLGCRYLRFCKFNRSNTTLPPPTLQTTYNTESAMYSLASPKAQCLLMIYLLSFCEHSDERRGASTHATGKAASFCSGGLVDVRPDRPGTPCVHFEGGCRVLGAMSANHYFRLYAFVTWKRSARRAPLDLPPTCVA